MLQPHLYKSGHVGSGLLILSTAPGLHNRSIGHHGNENELCEVIMNPDCSIRILMSSRPFISTRLHLAAAVWHLDMSVFIKKFVT